MMKISIIPKEDVNKIWHLIHSYMEGVAKYTYGRFTADDIRNGLLTKPQQLWIAFDDNKIYGAVVTSFTYYPRMVGLDMVFTGGIELNKWKVPMLEMLQMFAKDNGCSIIESYGRTGWEKVFKDDGFKKRFVFYELPVEKQL